MPRVIISGYYGFKNNGDEAMLYSILNVLGQSVSDLQAVVLSKKPQETNEFHLVEAVPRHKLCTIVKELRKADLLISGSGGLLQDSTGPNSILYYLGIVLLAKLMGKPVVFYSQGVGPVRTVLGKMMMKLVANRVDLITVRDEESKKELDFLGVKKPPIYVTADPALCFSLDDINLRIGLDILKDLGVNLDIPLVGISVRNWKDLEDYKVVIAKVCDDLVAKGMQVIFLPMHYPADVKVSKEIALFMKNSSFVVERELNFLEMLSLMKNLKITLGMRLHFLIFSALLNIPMVGISYDPKVDSFLNLVQMPLGGSVDNLQYEVLEKEINKALSGEDILKEQLSLKIPPLKKKSFKSAELIVKMLNKS